MIVHGKGSTQNTLLYRKGIKKGQNKSMETTEYNGSVVCGPHLVRNVDYVLTFVEDFGIVLFWGNITQSIWQH